MRSFSTLLAFLTLLLPSTFATPRAPPFESRHRGVPYRLDSSSRNPRRKHNVARDCSLPYTSPYKLALNSSGSSFFNDWDFFTADDPTHGQVTFLSADEAWSKGLVSTTSKGSTIMKVDDESWLARGAKRDSVRITSKQSVGIGSLVLLDVVKIPYGPSVWPAFWTVGDNWPSGGEIDILEGVHKCDFRLCLG
jgi:beta-glucanase (GH16 family)